MESNKTVRSLMPRKDELQTARPAAEGSPYPAPYIPATSHVPSLWDYWPIVLRHKWTILSCMLVALLGTVVSFSTTTDNTSRCGHILSAYVGIPSL